MKHFEILWEEAEVEITKHNLQLNQVFDLLIENINKIKEASPENVSNSFGEVVLLLSYLSSHFNVNAYSELQKVVWDWKSARLDKGNNT